MMSVVACCWTFAVLLYTTWPTGLVSGQSPPPAKIYVQEFTTAKIPYTYVYSYDIHEIKYFYTPSPGQRIHFYSVDEKGKPVLVKVVAGNRFENRVKYTGGDTARDATLTIERFIKEDEGKFEIEIFGDSPDDTSAKTTLQAIVLANVTKFETNKNDIQEGDNITLSCTVTKGLPSPRIEILKSNRRINKLIGSNTSDTTLKLNFPQISRTSGGSYSCKVTTEEYVDFRTYEFKVKYAPKFTQSGNIVQPGCIGKTINFNCEADGNPKPTVHVILPDGSVSEKFTIKLKRFGVYRCEAKNNLGNESRNITVSEATVKPKKPSFTNDCKFDRLTWEQVSDGVTLTLQFKEKNSEEPWKDVITTPDTSYSPSTNNSFSKKQDYEFRLFAENCVGNVISDICSVKGNSPSSGAQSSSNAGVIAGSVIAVMVVLLIIVIVLVVLKKRGSFGGRKSEENKPMYNVPTSTTPQETRSHKTGETMHYSDLTHDDDERHPTPPPSTEATNYAEIAHPDNSNAPAYPNNIPSWV